MMTLSSQCFANFQTCMSIRRPSKCSAACRCFVRFLPNAYECGQVMQYTLSRVLERAFQAHSDSLLTSLMIITMLVAVVGVKRTLLQRLLGGWAFALAFRREVFASLDVSCTAAATVPPSRRCRANFALLDELLFITGLALSFQKNWRAEPCEKLYNTDASPKWRWRLRCAHDAGGLARPVRFGRGERRTRAR